jgi:ABC-type sugar transport system substrate-binding protein
MTNKLVVIPHRVSGPLWLSERVGIIEAAERQHSTIYWSGPNEEGSLDEQYEIAHRAIQEGAAGIILSPNANRAFKRELLEAQDRRIPVVLAGEAAGIEPAPGVSLVISDLDETGRLIAQRLGQLLDHHGRILIVGLDPHTPGSVERSDAIVAALARYEPKVEVADRIFGSSSPMHSETLIKQALLNYPEARALVALNAGANVASASAARTLQKLPGLKIIGCDQSQPVFMLLHMGVLDSLLIQDNRRQGNLAVELLRAMRAGQFKSHTDYVKPMLVTRENIESEPVQQLLLMHR